jgi:hypothetical protein
VSIEANRDESAREREKEKRRNTLDPDQRLKVMFMDANMLSSTSEDAA